MSRNITPIANNQTFEDWVQGTNNVIDAMLDTVTVNIGDGDLTTGNGFIIGVFGSNTLLAGEGIRGGNVSHSANLVIASNTTFNGGVNIPNQTVNVVSNSITFSSNSTVTAFKVTANSTVTTVNVGAANLGISSNATFSGSLLRIPTGNTGVRPAASANGYIRFNSETQLLEVSSANAEWKSIVASEGGQIVSNTVVFANNANVTSTDIESAINEVYEKKVNKAGDTMTGNLVINRTGGAVPTAAPGSIVQVVGSDGANTVVSLDSATGVSRFVGRRSQGTNATRTALANGSTIMIVGAGGHNGTAFVEEKAFIEFQSAQAWSLANNATRVIVKTTPIGSTTPANVMVMTSSNVVITPALHVQGNITTGGTVYANGDITAFSDVRSKDDIETIKDALNKVYNLRGVTYTRDGVPGTGVIAQEVQKVVPELVREKDGYLSVAYGNALGLLVEAIKDLTDTVRDQQGLLEEAETRIEQLEARIGS